MAQQKGIIPLQGTLGNITFFKSKDGYMAREKGSLDASRIANDPAFQRTRENGAEFGRAGKAGKILRTALFPRRVSYSCRLASRCLTAGLVCKVWTRRPWPVASSAFNEL